VLRIRSLAKSCDGPRRRVVLDDVNLERQVGEYVAVMGESGVGRATLLNWIAGWNDPRRERSRSMASTSPGSARPKTR
jgi:ABC-type nitrate/sulfonate/bicarbonate transport system ATPase subunit